ncbi:MAG TPA: DUF4194 domain-containing protein [Anaerolineae bacterium]|nr:DUF4194 domain-containing protein [Anaerolineae bacterium]
MADIVPYAPVVLRLLQGPLYQENGEIWNLLLQYEAAVQSYLARIGLALVVAEVDGYAYLHQPEPDNDEGVSPALPRLLRRVRLTYDVTLLCVLLRERLLQFETRATGSTRLVLTAEQIREMASLFFQERADEVRLLRELDRVIRQVEELGFLRRLQGQEIAYEIRPILKARISADQLVEIKQKLQDYANTAA